MILAINAGSTSLKYSLFDKTLKELVRGDFSDTEVSKQHFEDIKNELGAWKHEGELKIVHRVVHGGHFYRSPQKLTPRVMRAIQKSTYLAPLHNPHNIKGMQLAKRTFKDARQYVVFDTGYFKNLPEHAKLYPIPLRYAKKQHIYRYGFHGISHEYAYEEARKHLRKRSANMITIHLGGGCSITAIKKGKPIDTSMGYSPLEGLMMWSRSGDVDPKLAIMLHGSVLEHNAGLRV